MSEAPDKQAKSEDSSLVTVLSELVRRLRSQPLVFGVAILVLLVIAGSQATNSLAALRVPALIIFGVGVLVWLIVELPRARSAAAAPLKKGINVRTRDVGKTGRVTGIEGLPASRSAPTSVDVDAERVEGDVAGARFTTDPRSGKDE